MARQMLKKYQAHFKLKSVSKKQQAATLERARSMIEMARKRESLRVLTKNGKIQAIVGCASAKSPRIKGQQSLFYIFEPRSLSKIRPWLINNLGQIAKKAPRYTEIKFLPREDLFLGSAMKKAGLKTRYEILRGKSKIALRNLIAKKSPSRNLEHLGLDIRPILSASMLPEMMKLQRTVSRHAGTHVYFSNSARQLEEDRNEYKEIITRKNGLLLGVYSGRRLLGFMLASVQQEPGTGHKTGGISFFLHPSIQGLGITKTGYRLMLEYLVKNNALGFQGGTSQPAILSLGKIMKRKVAQVIYVKM